MRRFDWQTITGGLLAPLPALGDHQVVVIEAGLEIVDAVREPLTSILSADERERAGRFVFARDCRRYVVAHAALRLVLAHYLDEDPRQLAFERGSHGKPRMASIPTDTLTFNLSHSTERALIAVARGREVGVDIEAQQPDLDIHALARQVLSAVEQRAFAAVDPEHQRAAFFRGWARKESFVKALGEGLSCPLDSFDVSLDHEVESALLACRHLPTGLTGWTTVPLDVGPDAAAALTASGMLRLERRSRSVWTLT